MTSERRDEEIGQFISETLGTYTVTPDDLRDLDAFAEEIISLAIDYMREAGEEVELPGNAHERIVEYYRDMLARYTYDDERGVWRER